MDSNYTAPFTELHVFIKSKPRRRKKQTNPALVESHGSSTLCMWTSVRSIFPLLFSCLSLCLSLLCDPIFLHSLTPPPHTHTLQMFISSRFSLMCFAFLLFITPFLFVSFIFVIVHVQASLTWWKCKKTKQNNKKKKDFSCWSHAKCFELPLKYGSVFWMLYILSAVK